MDAHEKLQIKERIKLEIAEAEELILELGELTRPIEPDNAIGRISRMEAINNKSVNEHLLSKTKQKLQKLEAALLFIDTEDYGYCRSCRQPIPMGRLMMMPESDKCVECA